MFLGFLQCCLMAAIVAAASEETCETDGTCAAANKKCGVHSEICQGGGGGSLYKHGGSAQAYVPDSPVKFNVCDENLGGKYKVASWRFSRRSAAAAPKLHVRANLWSCGGSAEKDECCCESTKNNVKIEIWQARPDGTYLSLQDATGDCRATLFSNETSFVDFITLAPGSTGSLGGLGPSGWDIAPYSPPVIHMLVSSAQHEPLLIELPVLVHLKTLQRKSVGKPTNAYEITSWEKVGENQIKVELDIFLTQGASSFDLCQSYLFGMPTSFFVEPISLCAPSLFDFFPL